MGKHLKAISFAALALLAIGGVLWSVRHLREDKMISTNDARIEATIVSVGSRISDRVIEISAEEGDHVVKGQVIAVLDSRSIQAKLAGARAHVALMKAHYDEILAGTRLHDIEEQKARVALSEASLERARRDHERIEKLVAEDAGISLTDRDAAKAAFLAAEALVKAEKENLALKEEGSREEEKRSALAQWQGAEAEMEEVKVLAEECTIKSPVSGIVAQKMVGTGELVSVGQKLFSIVDEEDMWLNIRVEETRIGRLKPGQDVEFSIDGYPGRVFHGKITRIGAATYSTFTLLSTENISGYFTKVMQRIPVRVSLPKEEKEIVFRPGMQGAARIDF